MKRVREIFEDTSIMDAIIFVVSVSAFVIFCVYFGNTYLTQGIFNIAVFLSSIIVGLTAFTFVKCIQFITCLRSERSFMDETSMPLFILCVILLGFSCTLVSSYETFEITNNKDYYFDRGLDISNYNKDTIVVYKKSSGQRVHIGDISTGIPLESKQNFRVFKTIRYNAYGTLTGFDYSFKFD